MEPGGYRAILYTRCAQLLTRGKEGIATQELLGAGSGIVLNFIVFIKGDRSIDRLDHEIADVIAACIVLLPVSIAIHGWFNP